MKNVTSIIEAAYILPVLIEHWKNPTNESWAILNKHGIDQAELYKYNHLLEYHEQFLRTRAENYPLLRKGLDQYFENDLSEIFNKLGINHKQWYFLDYAAGNGAYAKQFIFDNPWSTALCVDKSLATSLGKRINYMTVDFEKNPDWYKPYLEEFDAILLSEILHCKNFTGKEYLINSSTYMLKKGGILIVNENYDLEMQWRISQIKGKTTRLITDEDIYELTKKRFELINKQTINQHTAYVLQKL